MNSPTKGSDEIAAACAGPVCVSHRLRHSTGIPLVSSLHFTETAAVLWWAGRVAHCVMSHHGSALYSDAATIPNIVTVSIHILYKTLL
jgi:hypothetical protein